MCLVFGRHLNYEKIAEMDYCIVSYTGNQADQSDSMSLALSVIMSTKVGPSLVIFLKLHSFPSVSQVSDLLAYNIFITGRGGRVVEVFAQIRVDWLLKAQVQIPLGDIYMVKIVSAIMDSLWISMDCDVTLLK